MMKAQELHKILAGDRPDAAVWVEAASACGIVEAQVRLGRMLLEGEGAARSLQAAFACFRAAADGDDPDALNMLGRCYENGWGTAADPTRAADCYRRAAEAGLAWAQYNLGHMFLNGTGASRDHKAAFGWYRRAADQGHARAMNLVARCYEEGWGIGRDRISAKLWYRRSAEGRYFRGAFNYAAMLTDEGEIEEAAPWFAKALRDAPEPTRSFMTRRLALHPEPSIRALA